MKETGPLHSFVREGQASRVEDETEVVYHVRFTASSFLSPLPFLTISSHDSELKVATQARVFLPVSCVSGLTSETRHNHKMLSAFLEICLLLRPSVQVHCI